MRGDTMLTVGIVTVVILLTVSSRWAAVKLFDKIGLKSFN